MPIIAKKRLLKKKYEKHLLSSFQKTKSTQTRRSVFLDRIEQVKKIKFELELTESVDGFLDGHGNYTSNLVPFRIKSLYTNNFLKSKETCKKSIGVLIKHIKNPSAIKNAIPKKIVPNVRQTHATNS